MLTGKSLCCGKDSNQCFSWISRRRYEPANHSSPTLLTTSPLYLSSFYFLIYFCLSFLLFVFYSSSSFSIPFYLLSPSSALSVVFLSHLLLLLLLLWVVHQAGSVERSQGISKMSNNVFFFSLFKDFFTSREINKMCHTYFRRFL